MLHIHIILLQQFRFFISSFILGFTFPVGAAPYFSWFSHRILHILLLIVEVFSNLPISRRPKGLGKREIRSRDASRLIQTSTDSSSCPHREQVAGSLRAGLHCVVSVLLPALHLY